jgi:hypothetical protein
MKRRDHGTHITSHNQSGGITAGSVTVDNRGVSEKKRWGWVERLSWIAGIVGAAIAVALFFKGGNILEKSNQKNNQQGTTNVSSFNQSGGITAGTVNIGPAKRVLNDSIREQLDAATVGKKSISIDAVMGDAEAFQFATEIFDYLKAKGLPVINGGVSQSVYNGPIKGQTLKELPDDGLEIVIGSRQ